MVHLVPQAGLPDLVEPVKRLQVHAAAIREQHSMKDDRQASAVRRTIGLPGRRKHAQWRPDEQLGSEERDGDHNAAQAGEAGKALARPRHPPKA